MCTKHRILQYNRTAYKIKNYAIVTQMSRSIRVRACNKVIIKDVLTKVCKNITLNFNIGNPHISYISNIY